ncbi:MAG TPA: hypothetical protein PKE29_15395 [Phycisphaerales bacterium]|nr:hypothetical protein [Phycisphaerales bacterium]
MVCPLKPPPSTRTERLYYCSDFRGNVVAMLTADGKVAEQYRYSASSVPFGLPQGNVKSDGAVDAATTGTTDWTITDYIRVNTYEARADFDLDGDVDSADLAIVTANNGMVTGRGAFTVAAVANVVGFGNDQALLRGTAGLWMSATGHVFSSFHSVNLNGTALAWAIPLDLIPQVALCKIIVVVVVIIVFGVTITYVTEEMVCTLRPIPQIRPIEIPIDRPISIPFNPTPNERRLMCTADALITFDKCIASGGTPIECLEEAYEVYIECLKHGYRF